MEIRDILGASPNCLTEGQSWDEYTSLPAINPSTLVHGLESLEELKWVWDHPRPDTPAFQLGRAVHCLVFEGGQFAHRYCCWDGKVRRGKAYEAFRLDNPGKEALTKSDWDAAIAMASKVVTDPVVEPYIQAGKAEVGIQCQEGAVRCRGRMDWVSSDGWLCDLKTTQSINPFEFGKDSYRFHYDHKMGLYWRWLRKVTGVNHKVALIAVEKAPPYAVGVFPMPEPVVEQGAAEMVEVIARLPYAIEADCWPGKSGGQEMEFVTPPWEMKEEELTGAEVINHAD